MRGLHSDTSNGPLIILQKMHDAILLDIGDMLVSRMSGQCER